MLKQTTPGSCATNSAWILHKWLTAMQIAKRSIMQNYSTESEPQNTLILNGFASPTLT